MGIETKTKSELETRRAEIREGIADIVMSLPFYTTPVEQLKELMGEEVCRYLHSKGVALTIDRELPSPKDLKYLMWTEYEITEAGYTATEP